MDSIVLLHRAYYKENLLAASVNLHILESYMKNVRKLSKKGYHIISSNISTDHILLLYDQEFLREYIKDIYLPQRDCNSLNREVENEYNHYLSTLENMKEYYNQIHDIPNMHKHASQLLDSIKNMEEDLHSKKILKKLKKNIVKKSILLTSNIDEYLKIIRSNEESDELDSEYRYKFYND